MIKQVITLNPASAAGSTDFTFPYDPSAQGSANAHVVFTEGDRIIDPQPLITQKAPLPHRRIYALFCQAGRQDGSGNMNYPVYAVGEVIGISGVDSAGLNTIYLASFFNASFPNSPSFNNVDITGLTAFNAKVVPFSALSRSTNMFYPSGIPDWGTDVSPTELVLPDSPPESSWMQGTYRYTPKGQKTRSLHFLATPEGTVSRAGDYVVRNILHAEFVVDVGNDQYRVLAGFSWPIAVNVTTQQIGWMVWKSWGAELVPEINTAPLSYDDNWVGDTAYYCRLLSPQIMSGVSDRG